MRKFLLWIVALMLVVVAAGMVLPWHQWVQNKLIAAIEAKGFSPATLTIDHLGWNGVVLKDVTLGNPPLKLATLTVGYQPRALLQGQIEDAQVSGLTINATQTNGAWQIDGLEKMLQQNTSDQPAAIPVTLAELSVLPLRSFGVNDSQLHVSKPGLQADIPLTLMLHNDTAATIHVESKVGAIRAGDTSIALGSLSLDLALDTAKQQWNGTWAIEDMAISSQALPLPKLKAAGTLTLLRDNVALVGTITSDDKSHQAAFSVNYSLSKPETSVIAVSNASMPWSGGKIAAHNVRVPLAEKKAITLNLDVQKVMVDTLMDALTDHRSTATGTVSGTLPVTIAADGSFRIGKGALTAEGPGVITLSPEVIPGDNPQVGLVRDVLKNLHYTVLALGLEMTPDNKLLATLAVEGANPDVQGGRAVKLQVHLSGDLLNLILQNLQLMTDPKTFIEQNKHETH